MRRFGLLSKWGMIALVAAAMAATPGALVNGQAYAGPEPDCGPNFDWICVVPGCPTCPPVFFDGTVCEKAQFERETGRVCSRA